jgi:hypothetical protein
MRLLHFLNERTEYVVFLEDDDDSEIEDHQRSGFKLDSESTIEVIEGAPLLGYGDVYIVDR